MTLVRRFKEQGLIKVKDRPTAPCPPERRPPAPRGTRLEKLCPYN